LSGKVSFYTVAQPGEQRKLQIKRLQPLKFFVNAKEPFFQKENSSLSINAKAGYKGQRAEPPGFPKEFLRRKPRCKKMPLHFKDD
jgi:hypothetical protein